MTRRRFLGAVSAAAGGVAAARLAACSEPVGHVPGLTAAHRITSKPNFIVILADDLGYGDIGPFGQLAIRTPALDLLADEGSILTSFYVPSPICTPSRAGLLTGRHQVRHGLTDVLLEPDTEGLPSDEVTLAEALRRAGYVTGCVGKWHLGHSSQDRFPLAHGFDRFFGIPYSHDMRPLPLYRDDRVIAPEADRERLIERFTDAAIDFIDEHKDLAFFLFLPYSAPHIPLKPSARFRGRSAAGAYGDVVEELDWSVGRILAALDQTELVDDTLVVFTSDNGPSLNCACGTARPLRDGKRSVYEGGVRVPCIARWPGHVPAGERNDTPASTLDLLPTLARWAGTEVSPDIALDGRDIGTIFGGSAQASERLFVFFITGTQVRAVRRGRWKLHLPTREQPAELYDLETDLGETDDLAAERSEVVQELRSAVATWRSQLAPETGP